MTEKIPLVLSEKPSIDELEECVAIGANYICHDFESAREAYKRGQLAQRDADVAYYEPLIQQAKEEERREIFEKIEGQWHSDSAHAISVVIRLGKYMNKAEWQALKDKYPKGGQDES